MYNKRIHKIRLKVSSGKGGHGCLSFASSKRRVRGGPDGGDGGRGGDVWIRVNSKQTSLSHLNKNKIYQAGSGSPGKSGRKTGRKGENLIIEVPPHTWLKTKNLEILIDEDKPYLLIKGGRGGRGNHYFKNSINQAPSKTGSVGKHQEMEIDLQVKKHTI